MLLSKHPSFVSVPQKSRSRPPSYAGGDSPVALRSRSSTCDSIQSGSSPSSNNPTTSAGRVIAFPAANAIGGSSYAQQQQQPGNSPKQHAINTSPGGITSSSMKNLTTSGSRKSLVSVSKLEVGHVTLKWFASL